MRRSFASQLLDIFIDLIEGLLRIRKERKEKNEEDA